MLFYQWETDEGRHKKFAYGLEVQGYGTKTIKCNVCGREWRRLVREDDFCIVMSNNNFPDFTSFLHYRLISHRALDILNNEKIKAFHVEPFPVISAELLTEERKREFRRDGDNVNKFGVDPPKYYWLRAEIGAQLHAMSNVILDQCAACGFRRVHSPDKSYVDPDQQIFIDLSTWDGSDLFAARESPAVIYATEKFREIYRDYKMTGLDFKETEGI
jgi:ribosomal protein L37E